MHHWDAWRDAGDARRGETMTLDQAGIGPKSQAILVVGGGIAGITAALEAAETGHEAAEREQRIATIKTLRRTAMEQTRQREWNQAHADPAATSCVDVAPIRLTPRVAWRRGFDRILAGPVAGRTLAAYGADVMLLNSPELPNIESIADTSRGKLSAWVDLKSDAGRDTLRKLIGQSRIFMQGYRPGALAALGFGPLDVARLRPGIVYVSLSAYGPAGPWSARRGFDSLVQTATGFNLAEAQALGVAQPRAMPLQILDYAAGYLLALGAQTALLRQARQGGSWHVQVSLAGVGHWLRGLGRVRGVPPATDHAEFLEFYPGGFGDVTALRHAARFAATPARWRRPAMPPGSHPPEWPQA